MDKKYFTLFKILFAVSGILLFAYLIYKIGPERIISDINLAGSRILFLIPLAISWHFLNSMAWYKLLCRTGMKIPFIKIFINKWAAESLNSALPIGNMGGEAFRVIMLSNNMNRENALSNIVQDRVIHYVGSFFFIISGSMIGVVYLDNLDIKVRLVIFAAILTLLAAFFVIRIILKKGLLRIKRKSIQKYTEAIFDDLFNNDFRTNLSVIALNFAARLLGTVEIYLVLQFIGIPLPFTTCLLFSSFLVLINLIFFIVPGGFGILEGGQVAFMAWLGLSPVAGMSLGIIRRLRLIIIVAIGLILVPLVPELKTRISLTPTTNP